MEGFVDDYSDAEDGVLIKQTILYISDQSQTSYFPDGLFTGAEGSNGRTEAEINYINYFFIAIVKQSPNHQQSISEDQKDSGN